MDLNEIIDHSKKVWVKLQILSVPGPIIDNRTYVAIQVRTNLLGLVGCDRNSRPCGFQHVQRCIQTRPIMFEAIVLTSQFKAW